MSTPITDIDSPGMVQRFANELLILIIEECQDDPQTLYSLSLVSSLFYNFSQPFLYQQATSTLSSHHEAFFLALQRHPHLTNYVKRYDSSYLVGNVNAEVTLSGTMNYMFTQMKNLEHLGLFVNDPHRVDEGTPDTSQFKAMKLRSIRLRRNHSYPRIEQGWWSQLIKSQSQTLEVLDVADMINFLPQSIDQTLAYPKLRVVKAAWQVHLNLLPNVKWLRIMDVADDINVFPTAGITKELGILEGFSTRFVGRQQEHATLLLNVVQSLSSVKYLGLSLQVDDIPNIKHILGLLPPTGINGLKALTLLCTSKYPWSLVTSKYKAIDTSRFIDIFKMCPDLRFIDIELPLFESGRPMHYLSTYRRIECKKPGQLHQYRMFTFQAAAVFNVYEVSRTKSSFHFE